MMRATFFRRWPIQRKLLTGVLLCLAVSTLISVAASVSLTTHALEKRIADVELPSVLAAIRSDIQRQVSEPLTSALDIAENHFLLQWEEHGQPAAGQPDFRAYAQRLKERHQASSVYWIGASNRVHFTEAGALRTVPANESWFDQFLSSGQAFKLDLGQDPTRHELTLFVNVKFTTDANQVGIAGLGLSMESLAKKLAQYRIGDTGTVMLVNGDSKVLVHGNPAYADGKHRLTDVPGYGISTVSSLMNKGQKFAHVTEQLGDVETMFASTFIPELNAYVVAQVPTAELLGVVKRAAWTGPLLAASIGCVIALLMATVIARALAGPVRRAASMLNEIANGDGDLSRRMEVESEDEIGQLSAAFNRFIDSLQVMVRQVRDSAMQIASVTAQVASGNQDLSDRTAQASSAIQQTAATMAGITDQLQVNAAGTLSAADLARSAHLVATRSSESMAEVERVMTNIDESSRSVAEIIGVIDSIAFQTNILALNAAVEAARAGEQGRGFAVVAGEVRMLAKRAADAAKEVRSLISIARAQTQAGTTQSRTVSATMVHLLQSVSQLSEFVGKVNESTQRQTQGIVELNTAVSQIDVATQQNSVLVEEVAAAAESLRKQAAMLDQTVGNFKLA
ncbi:methyl-accepting chemotaxis protein [Azohydromonas australica]|uniref:methyl-accepting chemotaxis protein n=1 Tax=Azohydromonas australica TaxID=364039 RepID=UPI001B7FE178